MPFSRELCVTAISCENIAYQTSALCMEQRVRRPLRRCTTRCAMPNDKEPLWESTTVQNLFRYGPSGTYFARFKVGGKPIRQSLETTVFSVAKQRLPDRIRDYRSRHESVRAFADGKMTVADAAEVYLRKVRASVSLKPRSKAYREMMMDFIRRSWPSLLETDVRKVSERDCENWLTRYQQRNAPTVVNNSIGTLRGCSRRRSAPERDSTIRLPDFRASGCGRNDWSFLHAKSS